MKYRKIIESGMLAAAIAFSGATGVTAYAQQTMTDVSDTAAETAEALGETAAEDTANEEENSDLSQDGETEDTVDGDTAEDTQNVDDQEEDEWADTLMADVKENSWLNVREDASEDSDVVGKLYYGSGAQIIEKGDEWTRISSGDVEGYVKNEYCVFGSDAKELAEEICDTTATTLVQSLRLRQEAGTDSKTITLIEINTEFKVDEDAGETDGWIAVEYDGGTAYISADYVQLELDVGEAVSIEEEEAQKAAAASESSSGTSQTTQSSSVSAGTDDVTLLAAIIQCEAGGESYEGKLAVGAVVVNRVKSGSYPNSISGVIYQSGQFSPASNGKLSSVLSSGNISSSCYKAAKAAISGTDNTGGATSFKPGKKNGGTVIGNQTFY